MEQAVFAKAERYQPAEWVSYGGVRLPQAFAGVAGEYRALHDAAGCADRSDRGLVQVSGGDRKAWLHNLITNVVKTLDDSAGVYAFATDVTGRVQFDVNVLCRAAALWLDIDRGAIPRALQHLDMRLITEDVQLADVSGEFARLGVYGPQASSVAARLGVANFAALPVLQQVALRSAAEVLLVRHDLGGLAGFELIVPSEQGADWWDRLAGEGGATPVGLAALEAARINAGVPWFGRDIDQEVIPPETGQVERGISYHKGCYLGQEVIERMRSRGVLPRRLVQLSFAGAVTPPAVLLSSGKEVGRVTSIAQQPETGVWIGMGYVRGALPPGTELTAGDGGIAAKIVSILQN